MYTRGTVLIGAICLIASGSCAWIAWKEISVLIRSRPTHSHSSNAFPMPPQLPGLSGYSKGELLTDCYYRLAAPAIEASSTLVQIASPCIDLSSSIVEVMPTHSFGWYVRALSYARTHKIDAFRESFQRSHVTAPNEQWLAELRVRLGEEKIDLLDEATEAYHQRDLTLLGSSTRGLLSLAGQYVSSPTSRERIANAVSTLASERQRQFLENVKAIRNQFQRY